MPVEIGLLVAIGWKPFVRRRRDDTWWPKVSAFVSAKPFCRYVRCFIGSRSDITTRAGAIINRLDVIRLQRAIWGLFNTVQPTQPYVHMLLPIMLPKRAQVAPQLQPPYQELTVKRPSAV